MHRGVDGLQIWVNLPAHRIMGCASTDGAQVEVPADTYSTRSDLQQSMPPRSDYCVRLRARAQQPARHSGNLPQGPLLTAPYLIVLTAPDPS